MVKALYRKWRPQDWDEVAAQEHVIQTLRNAVLNDRVAHAYLFAGPRGTGKTTCARLLAKAVNCLEPDLAKRPCNACEHCQLLTAGRFMDLIEIDAASNTSVDDVRDLRDKINFSPSQGRYKVYIIDEVHMLSTAAFNALLKTLEEPPPHAIFILATTEIHKIPATVLSRCQRHEFRRIPLNIIVEHLKKKCETEGIQADDKVFTEIARQATGSLRDAISLLDQLASTNQKITLEIAQTVLGTATSMRVVEIVSALIQNDSAKGLTQINQALDSGIDPRQLARQIVTYLRNILLYKMGNTNQVDVADEIRTILDNHARQFSMPALLQAIESFNQAAIKEQVNWHPGLGLELAFTSFLTINPTAKSPDSPQTQEAIKAPNVQQIEQTKKPEQKTSEPKVVDKPVQQKKQKTITSEKKKEQPEKTLNEEPAPPTQQDATIAPVENGDISISLIHTNWNKIKSLVGKHSRHTEGLLNSCKVAGLKSNSLILGFSTQTLKNMMDKEGNLNLMMDILEEVTGHPLRVQCIVTSQEGNPLPEDLEIDQDGMISTATRDLGGKISKAEEI